MKPDFASHRFVSIRSLHDLSPTTLIGALLTFALLWAGVMLFWAIVEPLGPLGERRTAGTGFAGADQSLLTRFDPFFRDAPAGGTVTVTSLPLKLFGTRLDQAVGRGSAIIAMPDGTQASYGVGDEIVPGVRLKSVAFDNVTIERGGVPEQLFLDQSVAASPVAASRPPVPLVTGNASAQAAK